MTSTETAASPVQPADRTFPRLGPVRLAVTDIDRALPVWRDLVGLRVRARTPEAVELGAGADTLIVLEAGAARPVVERTLGLYHVAIHVPARRDLALAVARLFSARYSNSPTDHLVSEATYLWDPDGNGIELTFETPWRGRLADDLSGGFFGTTADGKPHSGREAVDLDSLFGELREGESLAVPLPPGTRIGHVHVHVGDLDAAMRFYADTLGFTRQMLARNFRMGDVRSTYEPHIFAFNTWAGERAPRPPEGSAGLRWSTLLVPSAEALAALRGRLDAAGAPLADRGGVLETADPAGNRLRVAVAV